MYPEGAKKSHGNEVARLEYKCKFLCNLIPSLSFSQLGFLCFFLFLFSEKGFWLVSKLVSQYNMDQLHNFFFMSSISVPKLAAQFHNHLLKCFHLLQTHSDPVVDSYNLINKRSFRYNVVQIHAQL